MNDTFHCEDRDALVAYLYDECDPADRAAVAAHLSNCPACAEEIASLRATRTQLAAWTPPAASLGFQITRADERQDPLTFTPREGNGAALSHGTPERRASWWRDPLPAWAQAAAAALIFAAGLTAGTLGNSSGRDPVATASAPVATASPVPAAAPAQVAARVTPPAPSAPAVSAADLARLEQRLRAIESAQTANASARTVSAASVVRGDGQVTPAVQALIDQRLAVTEDRLSSNIALVAGAASNLEAQVRSMQQRQNLTGRVTLEQLEQNRESRGLLAMPASFRGQGR
jgi:hypothetical protein